MDEFIDGVLRVRGLEMIDPDGVTRAALHWVDDADAVVFEMWDPKQASSVILRADDGGLWLYVWQAGNEVASAGLTREGPSLSGLFIGEEE